MQLHFKSEEKCLYPLLIGGPAMNILERQTWAMPFTAAR